MSQATFSPSEAVPEGGTSGDFDKDRERMHRQMLSSVSHDLKTPLASIIGSLEVFERMKDKLQGAQKDELVKVALQEAYRLDNFITNILDMAKLDNGLVKPRHEAAEVSAVVRDCLLRLNHRLRHSTVNVKSTGTLDIATDAPLLTRAVCLILDNAVKYGGTPSVIDIEYGRKDDHIGFISIADNGRGIAQSQLGLIFNKYTRFAKEDQQNAGTGLGLAIARSIMNLLHGDVTAANQSNGSAILTITFPV
ncbi:MAG TPA: ATP-binding protein [Alphaproteobacteria bacterium]|nr:ATP-binding protein [Alphaproteobacteria bacterium]